MAKHRASVQAWLRGGGTGPVCVAAIAGFLALVSFLVAVPALAAPAQPGPVGGVAGTPCTASAKACVDLGRGLAWLLKDGKVTHGPVPISSGDTGRETPKGTFKVQWKNQDHVSSETGGPMPFAVFFAPGGIAFHEGMLSRASLGCVRLQRGDAIVFFDRLGAGDQVQVR